MDIMNEQAVDSKKKREEEARFKKMNQNKDQGLAFNYLSAGQKAVGKETMAASAFPEADFTQSKGKKKK